MSDERFARQYRFEPPPEFPLASPCTRIVHHLSGPIECAGSEIETGNLNPMEVLRGCDNPPLPPLAFTSRLGFSHPDTRARGGLLGPCFKTGQTEAS